DKQILKLSKLCEHWAIHNDSHKDSFKKWRKIARERDLFTVVEKLDKAIEMMDKSTEFLLSARDDLEKYF
ncbi:MAG: zinc transporter, partial [Candidatus Lokiarchaeota archaeon]|nr:zinc transporter [Candidatus Lokiarchaeota archaeon]